MNVNESTAALGQQRASHPEMSNLLPPLAVDLDGTLLRTDLLLESLLSLLRRSPLSLFLLPFWLLKGRAHLKREIARRGCLDVTLLPYRNDLLERLRVEHEKGRSLVLATASDEQLAQQVANHLRIFNSVLASDGSTNLTGERKRECLVSQFGEKGFDYAGNETRDLAVWSSARKAIVVSLNQHLVQAVEKVTPVEFVFEEPRPSFGEYFNALRPQQWMKNILIFVPIFAAHSFIELPLLGEAFLAFLAFCCCASAGYVFNDLFDLAADRHHPKKRLRPFASGRLTLWYGFAMVPVLTVLGCTLALLVSRLFLAIALVYFATTFTYSLYLKKIVLLDVLVLASIYTFRIFAGAEAVGIRPSGWLLGFSMFVFTSLAFVKRYGELVVMRSVDGEHATARSYELSDAELLATKGTASGYAAVLMLALYISSGAAKALYGRHELMWLLCPLLLYWLGYIWLVAHRGKMRDDPLIFALRDRTSRILILLMLGVALLAV